MGDMKNFLAELATLGGSSGDKTLRERLQWESKLGLYEALSHQKATTISYCIFNCSRDKFFDAVEAARIVAAAKEHGIGAILAEDRGDFDSWVEEVEPRRALPASFDDNEKRKIRDWCS